MLSPLPCTSSGYRSVVEQVERQRKSSSALILQYYYARLAQQTKPDLPTLAHVLVRVNILHMNTCFSLSPQRVKTQWRAHILPWTKIYCSYKKVKKRYEWDKILQILSSKSAYNDEAWNSGLNDKTLLSALVVIAMYSVICIILWAFGSHLSGLPQPTRPPDCACARGAGR